MALLIADVQTPKYLVMKIGDSFYPKTRMYLRFNPMSLFAESFEISKIFLPP